MHLEFYSIIFWGSIILLLRIVCVRILVRFTAYYVWTFWLVGVVNRLAEIVEK